MKSTRRSSSSSPSQYSDTRTMRHAADSVFPRRYIEEYLEIFTSAENISFLFNLAMRVKTGRDKEDSRYDRVSPFARSRATTLDGMLTSSTPCRTSTCFPSYRST